MSIPLNKTAKVHVEPWYFVQVGDAQMMLTDEQATALFTQLHDLFAEDPSLAERIDAIDSTCENWYADVDIRMAELRAEMEAIKEAIGHPEPPLPPESPTQPQTIPPGVTTKDALILHRHGEPWTDDETEQLRKWLHTDKTYPQIGVLMGRTAASVQIKASGTCDLYAIRNPDAVTEEAKATRALIDEIDAEKKRSVPPKACVIAAPPEPMSEPESVPVPATPEGDGWERFTPNGNGKRKGSASTKTVDDALTHLTASGTPWRASEDLLLRSTMNQGGTLSQAALLLKRSGAEVRERWVALCKEREEVRSA